MSRASIFQKVSLKKRFSQEIHLALGFLSDLRIKYKSYFIQFILLTRSPSPR